MYYEMNAKGSARRFGFRNRAARNAGGVAAQKLLPSTPQARLGRADVDPQKLSDLRHRMTHDVVQHENRGAPRLHAPQYAVYLPHLRTRLQLPFRQDAIRLGVDRIEVHRLEQPLFLGSPPQPIHGNMGSNGACPCLQLAASLEVPFCDRPNHTLEGDLHEIFELRRPVSQYPLQRLLDAR